MTSPATSETLATTDSDVIPAALTELLLDLVVEFGDPEHLEIHGDELEAVWSFEGANWGYSLHAFADSGTARSGFCYEEQRYFARHPSKLSSLTAKNILKSKSRAAARWGLN